MTGDDITDIEAYLHRSVPLTAAMGVRVRRVDPGGVELVAPLAPNLNHVGGAFGGSMSTLAVTAGWMLVHWHVRDRTPASTVVIAEQRMTYDRPVTGEFHAIAATPDRAAWSDFERALTRRGRGRIAVTARIEAGDEPVARFEGSFVALDA